MDSFSQHLEGSIGPDPPLSYRLQSGNLTGPRHGPPISHHLASLIPTTTPVRKIEEKREIQAESEQPAARKEYQSPYDQAYSYVQECRAWRKGKGTLYRPLEDYERAFDVKMPAADWFKLSSELEWGESDETYPRLSYNSSTSELIVQCMPSPLHQSISNVINEEFIAAKGSLSRDLRSRTRQSWGVEQNNFRGRWYDSNKQPDMAIEVCDANGTPKMKWVLETRFSETYERLVDDARLWLEGTSEVAIVVLVKFNETPRYRCPVDLSDDSGNKLEELGIPSDRGDIVYEDVCLEEPFGPATYRGLTWVGQITEVFLESWIRGEDGKAVQHGTRQDLLRTAQMNIPFDNLFPHGYFTAITINSEIFRSELSVETKKMAGFRCRELVRNYNKKWG